MEIQSTEVSLKNRTLIFFLLKTHHHKSKVTICSSSQKEARSISLPLGSKHGKDWTLKIYSYQFYFIYWFMYYRNEIFVLMGDTCTCIFIQRKCFIKPNNIRVLMLTSAELSVHLFVNFSHFHLLPQNRRVNFDKTWHPWVKGIQFILKKKAMLLSEGR